MFIEPEFYEYLTKFNISKTFKKAFRNISANKSKKFHSLRHTFAVRRIV